MILSLARPPHIIFNTNAHKLTMNFPEIKFMIITEKQFMIIRGSFTAIHVKKRRVMVPPIPAKTPDVGAGLSSPKTRYIGGNKGTR